MAANTVIMKLSIPKQQSICASTSSFLDYHSTNYLYNSQSSSAFVKSLTHSASSKSFGFGSSQGEKSSSHLGRVNALPPVNFSLPDHLPLMAVLVQHMEGQRDLITHKSIWHLSDKAIKNVYLFYSMFTIWGCCFFGSTKDPYYDSELYRGDGGDGSGNWIYTKQEDIEESSRAELWREELIEEIELKVGGLRELRDADPTKEEMVK